MDVQSDNIKYCRTCRVTLHRPSYPGIDTFISQLLEKTEKLKVRCVKKTFTNEQ